MEKFPKLHVLIVDEEPLIRRSDLRESPGPRAARVLRSFEATHIDLARADAIVETLGVEALGALILVRNFRVASV